MKTLAFFVLAGSLLALPGAAFATDANATAKPDNRLVIVDGHSHNVIYDDGRDDLYCVSRVHYWRDEYGNLHRKRGMRCR